MLIYNFICVNWIYSLEHPHQTPKTQFIRCAKSQKFCHMWTVPLQICNGTDEKWYNFYCFLFSFLSPLSSVYSFLFSLTSVLSHRFSSLSPLSSPILIADPSSPIVIVDPSSPISHWLHFASSSPISPGIVIVITDRNRRGHRRWGEIGVFVTIVGIDAEILIVGIDVEVR